MKKTTNLFTTKANLLTYSFEKSLNLIFSKMWEWKMWRVLPLLKEKRKMHNIIGENQFVHDISIGHNMNKHKYVYYFIWIIQNSEFDFIDNCYSHKSQISMRICFVRVKNGQ